MTACKIGTKTPGLINGHTELIAHIGFPTHSFKAPMIYNPWFDEAGVNALRGRLIAHYPRLQVDAGSNDPAGFDLVVNGTPLGMDDGDAMPVDVSRIAPTTFVGEVVMKKEMTAFLAAAKARSCPVQIGTDMLFEQIPAYLEFFGYPSTTPEVLRAVATLAY